MGHSTLYAGFRMQRTALKIHFSVHVVNYSTHTRLYCLTVNYGQKGNVWINHFISETKNLVPPIYERTMKIFVFVFVFKLNINNRHISTAIVYTALCPAKWDTIGPWPLPRSPIDLNSHDTCLVTIVQLLINRSSCNRVIFSFRNVTFSFDI